MNIWVKSLLIGFGVTALAILYFRIAFKPIKKFRAEYLVKVEPVERTGTKPALAQFAIILEERLKTAGYEYKIKKGNNETLSVLISNLTDTVRSGNILTNNSRIQFRELYTVPELTNSLIAVSELAAKLFPPKEEPISKISNDSISPEVRDLLDSMDAGNEEEKKAEVGIYSLLHDIPINGSSAGYVGKVFPKDTLLLMDMLRSRKVKQQSPFDVEFYYGPENQAYSKHPKDPLLLYAIRTRGSDKAILENEDIRWAKAEFETNGRPMITFEFNHAGSIKWENLTRENINHPIAIIFDKTVISAPNVSSVIIGGKVEMTGAFTYNECQTLAMQLQSKRTPVVSKIISSKITSARSSNFLVYLLVMVFSSAIAWFIFFMIKPEEPGK
jgi:preprotein translocase subunit SecD